jgi:hypothetical protein
MVCTQTVQAGGRLGRLGHLRGVQKGVQINRAQRARLLQGVDFALQIPEDNHDLVKTRAVSKHHDLHLLEVS